jgi:hypothetical protein
MHYFLSVGSVCSRKEIKRTQNSHNPKTVIFPWKTFAWANKQQIFIARRKTNNKTRTI